MGTKPRYTFLIGSHQAPLRPTETRFSTSDGGSRSSGPGASGAVGPTRPLFRDARDPAPTGGGPRHVATYFCRVPVSPTARRAGPSRDPVPHGPQHRVSCPEPTDGASSPGSPRAQDATC